MAASKSQKIQAEIDKVKAKISEQQTRLKNWSKSTGRRKTRRSWTLCGA